MKVVFIAAEAVPFAKVGGLADVVGALPPALAGEGIDVSICLPFYRQVDTGKLGVTLTPEFSTRISMGPLGEKPLEVFRTTLPGHDIPVYLFHNEEYFQRDGVYTDPPTGREYEDGAERYIFFNLACLEFLPRLGEDLGVIHCHDSHASLVPALKSIQPERFPALRHIGCLLTIHNIAYQGLYPPEVLPLMGVDPGLFYPMSPFEYYGKVNFLKLGIYYSDLINTVSERYAREIQESAEYGCGLEGILQDRAEDVFGVLNGVDYGAWSPESDTLIPHNYDINYPEGKLENKKALLREYGFTDIDLQRPVIGMVGRLVDQKGIDLLMPLLSRLAREKIYLVVLGTGLPEYQERFRETAERYPDMLGVNIGFDNRLAHLIEAGSDLFLMPSRYEPCGLNQMYSLRYGTVPVVRATGGLADTVVPFDPATGEGTGFVFEEYTSEALEEQILRAVRLFADKPAWLNLMRNGMSRDYSWRHSAWRYIRLYEQIRLQRQP